MLPFSVYKITAHHYLLSYTFLEKTYIIHRFLGEKEGKLTSKLEI